MSRLKVRQARSIARREAIVAAAIQVFGKDGVHAATLTGISRAAGVPLTSIYDYFDSKTALLAALPETIFAAFFAQIDADLEARPDPVDKLECFFIRTLEYMERHPDWARVFFLEIWPAVVAGEPKIRQAVDAFGHRVIGIVASGIENGKLSANNDPYLIMSILLGTMAHLVSVWLLYQAPYDLVTQGRRSMALMRRLIEPDGPGASK
jgi:AcrR family transcriptional regulator